MKSYNVNQNFLLTLSQILQNPIDSYKLQTDSSILVLRQGSQIDIHFCNPGFTAIQNSLAIEGVKSLKRIRVTYFAFQKEAIIIYQKQNQIHYFRGKVPIENQNRIKSSYTESSIATYPWNHHLQILQISQLWLIQGVGVHSLIKTNQGSTYLLQYQENQRKLTIKNIETQGIFKKFGGALKFVMSPFVRNSTIYSNCSSFIQQRGNNNQDVFILQLLDTLLLMKNISLSNSSKNNHRIKSHWQVDLRQYFQSNSTIINSTFVFDYSTERNLVNLYVVSCAGTCKLNLYCFVIDFNTKIQKTMEILNLFQEEYQDQDRSSKQPDNVTMFDKYTDHVDIQLLGSKLYIIYHNKANHMINSLNKKKKVIAIIDKTQNNQWKEPKIHNLRIPGEIRLFKIQNNIILGQNKQMQQQNDIKLLILGESSCSQIDYFGQFQSDKSEFSILGQETIKKTKAQRINLQIPPIPQYEQHMQSMRQQKQLLSYLQEKQEPNQQYLNPFSTYKIQKYISKKDYGKLFEMFQQQKEQFNRLNKKSSYKQDNSYSQKLIDQFFIQIMFGLFTVQKGLNWQLQVTLIKQLFHQKLYKDYFSSDIQKLNNFIQGLFENKDTKNLQYIISLFFEKEYFQKIYIICVYSIPNFLQSRIQNNMSNSNSQQMKQNIKNPSIENLKNFIKLNYLAIYQRLIIQIFIKDPPNKVNSPINLKKNSSKGQRSIKILGQYQLKQLLQKYLSVKNATQTQYQTQNYKTQELSQLFSYYLQDWDTYGKFLIAMAMKYKNITLFDLLIKHRKVSKEDMRKFLNFKQISQQTQYVEGLLINLINKDLQKLRQQQNKFYNLKSLSWIPSQYFQKIYEHLISLQPKIAIMYGIMSKERRKVAKDISSRRQLKLFYTFKNPSDVLELYEPFYSYFTNAQLKLNIDLARLLTQMEPKKFIQARRLLRFQQSTEQIDESEQNKEKIKIQRQKWSNFQQKICQYLNENQIKLLRQHFAVL